MERRKFMKALGLAALSAPVLFLGKNWGALTAMAEGGDLPFANEKDQVPKGLKYCVNADKAIKAKAPACAERKKPERAKQYCNSCQLFQVARGTGKDAVGKCLIMPTNFVHGNDWCSSWVQKPGA